MTGVHWSYMSTNTRNRWFELKMECPIKVSVICHLGDNMEKNEALSIRIWKMP